MLASGSYSSSVNYDEEDIKIKVVIVGDPAVGKTSFVKQYVENRYSGNYRWTVGVDFALKVVKWSEDVSLKLQLWDIAGQERFTSMTRVYYRDAHACIIIFDLTQRRTFVNALKWKTDLDEKCRQSDGSPLPCILLANKCDLPHREVEQSEIENFCKEHDFIGWTETSVKENLMIEESMKFLLDEIMARYGTPDDQVSSEYDGPAKIQLKKAKDTDSNKSKKCSC